MLVILMEFFLLLLIHLVHTTYMYNTIPNAGPGKEIYTVGAGGQKGQEGSEEKVYCQVM